MNTNTSYIIHEIGYVDYNRQTDFRLAKNLCRRFIKLNQYKANNIQYLLENFVLVGLFECLQLDLTEEQSKLVDIPGSLLVDDVFVSSIRNLQKVFMNSTMVNLERLRLLLTASKLYPEFFNLQNFTFPSDVTPYKLFNKQAPEPYLFVRFTTSDLHRFSRIMTFLNLETMLESYSVMSDGTMIYQVEKNLVDVPYLKVDSGDEQANALYNEMLDKVYEYNAYCHKNKIKNGIQTFCLCDTIGVGFLSNWRRFGSRLKDEKKSILSQFGIELLDRINKFASGSN